MKWHFIFKLMNTFISEPAIFPMQIILPYDFPFISDFVLFLVFVFKF